MRLPNQTESENLLKITEFRKGYAHFLNQFMNLGIGLLNFLASGTVSENSKRELIPYRKEIDSNIVRTTQLAKNLILELDERHLIPSARKETSFYFKDGILDEHRLEFITMHKVFESLREFYNISKEAWTNIQYTVLSAGLTDESLKSEAILDYRVIPVISKLDSLKVFLERVAVLLAIDDPHLMFKARRTEPHYSGKVTYKLSTIFSEGLQKALEDDLIPDMGEFSEESSNIDSKSKSVNNSFRDEKRDIPRKLSSKNPPNVLNTAGKFPWNSNQHYYFRYEVERYLEEKKYFQSVINLDTHLGADEKILKAEIIRNMTSLQMKKKSPEELEGEYMIFLDHFFDFCRNILLMGMGIPDVLKFVFFYHIGPSHFYMIVRKFLQEANTGYLHIRSADKKKVTRFLPNEILKKHVVAFWNREILPNIGDERNNLSALKKIIEIVDNKYKEVSQYAIKEFEALPLDVKAEKPRVQIFREKMNTWMGAANIIVFKRFLKTAI